MKKFITLLAMLAIAGTVSASIVNYGAMDGVYETTGGQGFADTEHATVALSTSPDHTFFEIGGGGTSATKYYGGIITLSGTASGATDGLSVNFGIQNATNPGYDLGVYKASGAAGWLFDGTEPINQTEILNPAANQELAFVMKITDLVWTGTTLAEIFVGANAKSATEGTADATAVLKLSADAAATGLNEFRLDMWHADWVTGTATVTISDSYSADEWHAVAVPEPATVGMLGLGALVALLVRRVRA